MAGLVWQRLPPCLALHPAHQLAHVCRVAVLGRRSRQTRRPEDSQRMLLETHNRLNMEVDLKFIWDPVYSCAADFSLLNLPKGKSLGRSKPATNS
jgi:hypothetical protein